MEKINLKFYKFIQDVESCDSFEVYNMKLNDSIGEKPTSYLVIGNNKTNNIDIYAINSKDDFKLIHTIIIGKYNICEIKYFYNSYNDTHYLTALINGSKKIMIWRILKEKEYELILEYEDIQIQGGLISSRRPVRFETYNLIFTESLSFLFISYILQKGCTRRISYLELLDIFTGLNVLKFDVDEYYFGYFINCFLINKNNNDYLAIINSSSINLYNISQNNQSDSSEKIENGQIEKDYINLNFSGRVLKAIYTKENNEEEYLFCYQVEENDPCKKHIIKFNIKNNQILYKVEINIKDINSISI